MKKIISLAIAAVAIFAISMSAVAEEKAAHTFIGAKKCAMCHKGEAKGKVADTWMESKHAKAFASLSGEEAAAVMKKVGKEGKASETAECLACHVTNASFKEDGVSCESCHNAGSDYKDMKVMKDHAAAVAAGMNDKPKDACVKCHNDKNPTHKGEFKFDEMWKKIAHNRKGVAAEKK